MRRGEKKGNDKRKREGRAQLCTMCEQAPATTTYGFPVCQPCADWLTRLDGELQKMEDEEREGGEWGWVEYEE